MPPPVVIVILAASLTASVVSGVFGMAGGMLLMGALTWVLPVAVAMQVHGFSQALSNGWRCVLHVRHINWPIFGKYLVGAALAFLLLFAIAWAPDKRAIYLILGLTAFAAWIPQRSLDLDIQRPGMALACGFSMQALNLISGVAGPFLHVFFLPARLTRHEVVATKAMTQTLSHVLKMIFWAVPLMRAEGLSGLPPLWVWAAIVPVTAFGAWAGGKLLDALSDASFRNATKWILTGLGVVYLARGLGWL